MLTLNWSQQIPNTELSPPPQPSPFLLWPHIAAAHFFCRKLLFHCSHQHFSPRMCRARCMSFGIIHLFCCGRHCLFHCSHQRFSPRMRCASCMSFGIIVTCFAWIAHALVSWKRPTMYASAASWRARRAVLCIRKSDFMPQAILRTRRWKGAFLIKRSVPFWYTDLTKGDGPRAPTMGFLHATKGSG